MASSDLAAIAVRKPTAFIVDDDLAVRNSLRFSLEVEGLEVRTYSNAAELLRETTFPSRGCLIIDQKLPGMTGLDLLSELRRRRVSLPAIVITTNPSRAVRTEVAAAGATLIEKPLNEALHQAIRKAINSD